MITKQACITTDPFVIIALGMHDCVYLQLIYTFPVRLIWICGWEFHVRYASKNYWQYFHVVLFSVLYKVVRLWMKPWCVTIQMKAKAIEQYFHVIMFIMLYKVVLTFKSLDQTQVCDHSNESHWAVLPCGTVCYVVWGSVRL